MFIIEICTFFILLLVYFFSQVHYTVHKKHAYRSSTRYVFWRWRNFFIRHFTFMMNVMYWIGVSLLYTSISYLDCFNWCDFVSKFHCINLHREMKNSGHFLSCLCKKIERNDNVKGENVINMRQLREY